MPSMIRGMDGLGGAMHTRPRPAPSRGSQAAHRAPMHPSPSQVCLAKGPLVPNHALVLPIAHRACSLELGRIEDVCAEVMTGGDSNPMGPPHHPT